MVDASTSMQVVLQLPAGAKSLMPPPGVDDQAIIGLRSVSTLQTLNFRDSRKV